MIGALAAGLVAGAAHALLGPDHLAAVTPLSLRQGGRAAWIGVRWGVGHGLGALALGAGVVLARDALPWQGLSVWAERAVGGFLILLGLFALRQAARTVVHAHEHTHDGETHAHAHLHAPATGHAVAAVPRPAHAHAHAALGMGFLHGLAGFSHLWAALPALALPRDAAIAYLGGYGLGTVLAMAAFTSALGLLGARAGRRSTAALRALAGASGLAAIAVGVWWLWRGGV